jgi:hypothetical protein
MWLGAYVANSKEERSAFLPLLWEAYRRGQPTVADTLLYVMIWLVPLKVRRKAAFYFEKYR